MAEKPRSKTDTGNHRSLQLQWPLGAIEHHVHPSLIIHTSSKSSPIWAPAEFSPMVSNCGVSSVCSYNFNMCTMVQENFTVPVLVSAVAFI